MTHAPEDFRSPVTYRARPGIWQNPARPWQVTVIGYFLVVIGYLGVVWKPTSNANLFMDMKWLVETYVAPKLTPAEYAYALGFVVFGTITSIVALAAGIGLLKLRPWGRKLAMIYASLAITLTLVNVGWQLARFDRNVEIMMGSTTQPLDREAVARNRATQPLFGALASLVAPVAILTIMRKDFIRDAFGSRAARSGSSPRSDAGV